MERFSEYDQFVLEEDANSRNLAYPALGLTGEAGEVADKIKKLWRNKDIQDGSQLSPEDVLALEFELGDVFWYLSSLTRRIGSNLQTIAELNVQKGLDRKARGVIKSEGDNR